MIDRTHPLPVVRQCQLLKLARSTAYYQPTPVSEPTLALMRRIDELHLQYPFAGDVAALALGLLLLGPPPVEQMVGIPRFCATWTTGCRDS